MFCPNCGRNCTDGAAYCDYCGAVMPLEDGTYPSNKPATLKSCGAVIPLEDDTYSVGTKSQSRVPPVSAPIQPIVQQSAPPMSRMSYIPRQTVAGLICGYSSLLLLLLGFLLPSSPMRGVIFIIGIVISIIGIILSTLSKRHGYTGKAVTAGIVLNWIALIIGIIIGILLSCICSVARPAM